MYKYEGLLSKHFNCCTLSTENNSYSAKHWTNIEEEFDDDGRTNCCGFPPSSRPRLIAGEEEDGGAWRGMGGDQNNRLVPDISGGLGQEGRRV